MSAPPRIARRTGRPPLDRTDPSVGLSVKMPSREFDRVYQEARERGLSLSAFTRRILAQHARDDDEADDP